MAVSSTGGPLSSRGTGEGAESEELTVSKGGDVILPAERIVVQPKMNAYAFSYACFTQTYRDFINRQRPGI